MKLLVIEATPKKEQVKEGLVIYEFLNMTHPDLVCLEEFEGSNQLLNFLSSEQNLDGFDFIHLSGHGSVEGDTAVFHLPKGHLYPDDFPESCFQNRVTTFSACEMGKKTFVDLFIYQTGAEVVIAPQRDVEYIDSAVWFLNFYYFALELGTQAITAFNWTQEHLKRRIRGGAFQYWE